MFIEWQNNQAATMRCKDKWPETDDAVSIILEPSDRNRVQFNGFKPGQFVSLGIKIDEKVEYRAYSIASMPGEEHIKLTIKRVEGGLVSNYLLDQLCIGDQVSVLAPTGPFNSVDCPPQDKVVMLSAGCGITPVMSMSKTWLAEQTELDIVFVHMAKSVAQTIYFDELETMDAKHEHFHLKLLLKDNSGTRHPQGRLDLEWLKTLCPDIAQRTVYLCGPTQFMQDMERNAAQLGVESSQFHQESFTPIESHQTESSNGGVVQVDVPTFGVSTQVDQGATLADVLEGNGVPIIIACRSGMCGSCKCKVTKGEVSRSSTETLSEQDIANGYTLACSSQLQSDVEIELS